MRVVYLPVNDVVEFRTIQDFLGRVRGRARAEALARRLALVGLAVIFLLAAMALGAASTGPTALWPVLTTRVLPAVTVSVLLALVVIPWRRLRSDRAVAVLVGQRHPPVASDLLSAVELAAPSPLTPATPGHDSSELVRAFHGAVASHLHGVAPRQVVSFTGAGRGLLILTAAAAVLWGLARSGRTRVGEGLGLLTRRPTLFEGAAVAREPLVGDVQIVFSYPPYTGLPDRTVEGSSGDVVALKGTKVALRMRLLRSARRGLLLLGDRGETGQIETVIDKGLMRASFELAESSRYHIWLAPLLGRPVREQRGHQIQVDADQPPVVEIVGPADRLELESPRPIEVGYGASDDYGLRAIDLVFRVGNSPEKRVPLHDARGARAAKGKTVWDPTGESLMPGVPIAYRIEARDTDTVSGGAGGGRAIGKPGSSRTLYLIMERVRDSPDQSIEEQREILEGLVAVLADRLEGTVPAATIADNEAALVARLGRLVDQQRRAGGASQTLLATLSGIADRLNRLLRQRGAPAAAHIAALEDAALTLDDLIGRQRLEDLSNLGKQLTQAQERLQDLLARYQAAPDPALREQLLREMAELRRRIAELAAKVAAVKQRNEVPTEWQNMPDMDKLAAEAKQLEDALRKGDPESLASAMEKLKQELKSLQDALSGNANEFAEQRFPRENRALNELNKKIADLEGDERRLAEETDKLSRELDQALSEKRSQREAELMKDLEQRMKQLADKLAPRTPSDLGERVAEDHLRAREHTERAQRQIGGREIPETRKEIDEVARNLDHAQRIGRAKMNRASRAAEREASSEFMQRMADAEALARGISEDLGKLTPSSSEVASDEQRGRANEQAARQKAIGKRARELGEQAGQEGQGMPGFDRAASELGEAAGQMGEAAGNLGRGEPREALGQEQAAADRLARLRQSLNGERMGRSSEHHEPVPIPGQKEAPRAWRQELMEAMREKAPEKFREEVRRYYEDLVR